jgi:hypothetical protein
MSSRPTDHHHSGLTPYLRDVTLAFLIATVGGSLVWLLPTLHPHDVVAADASPVIARACADSAAVPDARVPRAGVERASCAHAVRVRATPLR